MPSSLGSLFRTLTRHSIGPFARSRVIVAVTVRDEDFRVVRQLSSDRELTAFRTLWYALVETDRATWTAPDGRAHFKLDVRHRSPDGRLHANRWLYHPDGCVNALAIFRKIWVAPLYRMPDPAAFEALLRDGKEN